ncbi:MAG: hypothetical protein K2G94_05490 [Muribaculaceae bacterium]|nr:hypothetical protein [Muribaculaceae bacterium]
MEIMTLEHIDFDTLFQSFEKAFADYEIHFEKDEVRSMLNRRGYNPRLSFAAFVNDEIVAFTLNGTGTFNGIPTAYDTGTGTLKNTEETASPERFSPIQSLFLKKKALANTCWKFCKTTTRRLPFIAR